MNKINQRIKIMRLMMNKLFTSSPLNQTTIKSMTIMILIKNRQKVKNKREVSEKKAVIEKSIRNINIFIPNQICTKFKSNRGKSERFLAQFPKLYL